MAGRAAGAHPGFEFFAAPAHDAATEPHRVRDAALGMQFPKGGFANVQQLGCGPSIDKQTGRDDLNLGQRERGGGSHLLVALRGCFFVSLRLGPTQIVGVPISGR